MQFYSTTIAKTFTTVKPPKNGKTEGPHKPRLTKGQTTLFSGLLKRTHDETNPKKNYAEN